MMTSHTNATTTSRMRNQTLLAARATRPATNSCGGSWFGASGAYNGVNAKECLQSSHELLLLCWSHNCKQSW
jgi:hypothetical protein